MDIESQMLYNLHIECIKVNVVETGGNGEELLRVGMGRGRCRLKNPKLRLEIYSAGCLPSMSTTLGVVLAAAKGHRISDRKN